MCQYANAFQQYSAANWHIGILAYWHIIINVKITLR